MKYFSYVVPAVMAGGFVLDGGLWGPVVLLMGLIFFHEAGHFLVAKWIGIPVSVFSLGFGPRLIGFNWNETDVRLSLLPFGGYVRLFEEDCEDSGGIYIKKLCSNRPTWSPVLFYAGGIIANVVIVILIFFWLGVSKSRIIDKHIVPSPLVIMEVSPGTAAARAGLQPMDQIHSVGSLNFPENSRKEIIDYICDRPGQTVSITIERKGVKETVKAILSNSANKGSLGVVFEADEWVYERSDLQLKDLRRGAVFAFVTTTRLGVDILGGLGKLVTHKASFKDVGGPIAIIRASSRAARAGLVEFLVLSALISMNLAVMNALPIPALDGGHIAIFLFERLRGKEISGPIKKQLFTGGFIILSLFMLIIVVMDIIKVFG